MKPYTLHITPSNRIGNSLYHYGTVELSLHMTDAVASLCAHLFGANSPVSAETSVPVDASLLEGLRLIKYHASSVCVAPYQAPDGAVLAPTYQNGTLVIPFASKGAHITELFTTTLADVLTAVSGQQARVTRATSH